MNINEIGVAIRQGEILGIRTTERGLACRSSIQEPCSNSKITASSYVGHYLASNAFTLALSVSTSAFKSLIACIIGEINS